MVVVVIVLQLCLLVLKICERKYCLKCRSDFHSEISGLCEPILLTGGRVFS